MIGSGRGLFENAVFKRVRVCEGCYLSLVSRWVSVTQLRYVALCQTTRP